MRLDNYVVEKTGLTKNKAQAMIKSGAICINQKVITKSGHIIKQTDTIEIIETDESKYVARSAMKLKKYLENNHRDLHRKVALDIGSSTGGFCQILLENEVSKIYAVDVGTSQLHETLHQRKEIISLENTDIRDLKFLPEKVDIITCDVSFIKLDMILNAIKQHISQETICIVLFKPQFEVGRDFINKKGVVRHERYSNVALNNFLDLCRGSGLSILNVEKSEMKGENGNEEVFIEFKLK